MGKAFWSSVCVSAVILTALIGVRVVARTVPDIVTDRPLGRALEIAQSRDLRARDRDEQVAGYYEGLLGEASRVSTVNRLVSGIGLVDNRRRDSPWAAMRRPGQYAFRGDFLYYEHRPNLDVADYGDETLRFRTNSLGLADREYPTAKSPGTRRIAVPGDSVTRGLGAPFGANYESLLEDRLNERHRSSDVSRFDVINFAVGGYRLTQILDVAIERIPAFSPDVYLLPLTELSVAGRWADHVRQLVIEGIDLKYDFLRQIVEEAGLRPNDPPARFHARLGEFRVTTVDQTVRAIERHAALQGASLIVLLVPTVRDGPATREPFTPLRSVLESLDVPVIDLLDTFDSVSDLDAYRVSPTNVHPNGPGHQLIFDNLYRRLREQPKVLQVLTGEAP